MNYCINDVDCRRVMLLEYFGESFDRQRCNGTCDNCTRPGKVVKKDYTEQVKSILQVVKMIEKSNRTKIFERMDERACDK